jgi:hypothetical protein
MKIPSWIPLIGTKKDYVTAIIVYPNKRVAKKKVEGNVSTFTVSTDKQKRKYAIDQKAIYLENNKPVLFYNSNNASPFLITNQDIDYTMSSTEFQGIIESKVVPELLEASKGGGWDMHFIASIIGAVTGILLLLNSGGLSFLTGGA